MDTCAKQFIKSRQGKVQPIVIEKLTILLLRHPEITKVYLVGSYANGDWINQDTPQWFIDYRKSIGKVKEVSDVDFYTVPAVPSSREYDVLSYLIPRGRKILLYDNGQTKV